MAKQLPFEENEASAIEEGGPAFLIDVDGYEGPLDLLLDLARRQKVDLAKISILALAEQYLAFVEQARAIRLELAADYLVMAAWLAYLKSRLLLPEPPKGDEPSAADLATALALRLKRLEAIRAAAGHLASRDRLGRDVFARGAPEPVIIARNPAFEATLYDLLSAYARQRQARGVMEHHVVTKRFVWSLVDAREALHRLVGVAGEWTALDSYLIRYAIEPGMRNTVRASALSATLEMVREGLVELRQDRPFAPLFVRSKPPAPPAIAAE